jgi:hypothetical protein
LDVSVPTLKTLCGDIVRAPVGVAARYNEGTLLKNIEELKAENAALKAEVDHGCMPQLGNELVTNLKKVEARITHFRGSWRAALRHWFEPLAGTVNSMSKTLCHSTNGVLCVV